MNRFESHLNIYKIILSITLLYFIGFSIKIQSTNGYSVGDNKYLNPFIFSKERVENPNFNKTVDPYFEKNVDYQEVYITSKQLQDIKYRKMIDILKYILPVILVTSILHYLNFKRNKKNEENSF